MGECVDDLTHGALADPEAADDPDSLWLKNVKFIAKGVWHHRIFSVQDLRWAHAFRACGKDLRGMFNLFEAPLGIIPSSSPVRLALVKIIDDPKFDAAILVIILLNVLVEILEIPSLSGYGWAHDLSKYADIVFLFLFTCEALMKIVAQGFLLHKWAYLRDAWNVIDFVIVVLGLLAEVYSGNDLTVIRLVRLARPLRAIRRVRGMRVLVNTIVLALPMMVDVVMMMLLVMYVFAAVGVQMWMGVLHQRCYYGSSEGSLIVANDTDVCGARECLPVSGITINCSIKGEVETVLNYDNIFSGMLLVFKIITLDDWPNDMNKIQDAYSFHAWIYFVGLTLLGGYFCLNLVLAILAVVYNETQRRKMSAIIRHLLHGAEVPTKLSHAEVTMGKRKVRKWRKVEEAQKRMEGRLQRKKVTRKQRTEDLIRRTFGPKKDYFTERERAEREERRDERRLTEDHLQYIPIELECANFFGLAIIQGIGAVAFPCALLPPGLDSDVESEFDDASSMRSMRSFGVMSQATPDVDMADVEEEGEKEEEKKQWCWSVRRHFKWVVDQGWFRNGTLGITIVNVLVMALDHNNASEELLNVIDKTNYTASCCFLAELVIKLFALGFFDYFRDNYNILDFVLVVISLPEILNITSNGPLTSLLALRALRGFRVMVRIRPLRTIVTGIAKSFIAVLWLLLLLMLLIFIYSMIGLSLFLNAYGPDDRENFRSLWQAAITVFVVITGDGWGSLMKKAMDSTGPMAWIYFVSLFSLGRLVITNLFIAILIDHFKEATTASEIKDRESDALERRRLPPLEMTTAMQKQVSFEAAGQMKDDVLSSSSGNEVKLIKEKDVETVEEQPEVPPLPSSSSSSACDDPDQKPLGRSDVTLTFDEEKVFDEAAEDMEAERVQEEMRRLEELEVKKTKILLSQWCGGWRVSYSERKGRLFWWHPASGRQSWYSPLMRGTGPKSKALTEDEAFRLKQVAGRLRSPPPIDDLPVANPLSETSRVAGGSVPRNSSTPGATEANELKCTSSAGSMLAETVYSVASEEEPSLSPPSYELTPEDYQILMHLSLNQVLRLPNLGGLRLLWYAASSATKIELQQIWNEGGAQKRDLIQDLAEDGTLTPQAFPPYRPVPGFDASTYTSPNRSYSFEPVNPLLLTFPDANTTRGGAPPDKPAVKEVGAIQEEKEVNQEEEGEVVEASPKSTRRVSIITTPVDIPLGESTVRSVSTALSLDSTLPRAYFEQYRLAEKSLGFIPIDNPLRVALGRVVLHRRFDDFIVLMIMVNAIFLALDDYYAEERPGGRELLEKANIVFVSLFITEMVAKIVVMGLWGTRCERAVDGSKAEAYLSSDFSNKLDCAVAITQLAGLCGVPYANKLRCARTLRILVRSEALNVVIRALLNAAPQIVYICVVCFFVWLVFGILGVSLFKGQYEWCNDPSITKEQLCTGSFLATTTNATSTEVVVNQTRSWSTFHSNFDNIAMAFLTLFELSAVEDWPPLMWRAVDGPEGNMSHPERAVFFVIFVVIGNFFCVNLFVGSLINQFNSDMETLLTRSQAKDAAYKRLLGLYSLDWIPPRPTQWLFLQCYRLIHHPRFDTFILIMILLNCIALGTQHYEQSDEHYTFLDMANLIFVIIFALEALVKIGGLGLGGYFSDPWNRFDFLCVTASLLGMLLTGVKVGVFRLLRMIRALRLLRRAKRLHMLFHTLLRSLPSLGNTVLLLTYIFFNWGVVGVEMFKNVRENEKLTSHTNFRTLPAAVLVLYQISTTETWTTVMQGTMIQPPHCNPDTGPNGEPPDCGKEWGSYVYFVSYLIVGSFIFMNLFIFVVLHNFENDRLDINNQKTDTARGDVHRGFNQLRKDWEDHIHQLRSKSKTDDLSYTRLDVDTFLRILPTLPEPLWRPPVREFFRTPASVKWLNMLRNIRSLPRRIPLYKPTRQYRFQFQVEYNDVLKALAMRAAGITKHDALHTYGKWDSSGDYYLEHLLGARRIIAIWRERKQINAERFKARRSTMAMRVLKRLNLLRQLSRRESDDHTVTPMSSARWKSVDESHRLLSSDAASLQVEDVVLEGKEGDVLNSPSRGVGSMLTGGRWSPTSPRTPESPRRSPMEARARWEGAVESIRREPSPASRWRSSWRRSSMFSSIPVMSLQDGADSPRAHPPSLMRGLHPYQ